MNLLNQIKKQTGQIAILIDPEKCDLIDLEKNASGLNQTYADYIFVGGSTVQKSQLEAVCTILKKVTTLPIIGFPGDVFQFSPNMDGLLYLSLLSGRNPEYLIGHHIHSSLEISNESFETIPTAYLLIDGAKPSSVAYVSQTTPIPQDQLSIIERTVMAGKLQGKQLLYLDAGSGAKMSVSPNIVMNLRSVGLPIIVGGGIRTQQQLVHLTEAGANVLVIGNHLEENPAFMNELYSFKKERSQSLKTGS